MKLIWGMVFMALTATTALAQSGGVNYYSKAELQQMAHKLEQQESFRSTGSAAETLDKYPGSFTMLSVRGVSGGAEVHEHYADIFFIVAGEATLTTGGTVVDPKTTAPGEIRGARVEGGVEHKLSKGDVVHIAPNTPHQVSIAKGKSLTYFVVKVKE
jgi:mannose-6-phosphate isomerase-like protein (cupin superfamily)